MAVTSWLLPNVAETLQRASGDTDWSNPNNIKTDDSNTADVDLSSQDESYFLIARDFSFSIPTGARVDGVEIEWKMTSNGGFDAHNLGLYVDGVGNVGSQGILQANHLCFVDGR